MKELLAYELIKPSKLTPSLVSQHQHMAWSWNLHQTLTNNWQIMIVDDDITFVTWPENNSQIRNKPTRFCISSSSDFDRYDKRWQKLRWQKICINDFVMIVKETGYNLQPGYKMRTRFCISRSASATECKLCQIRWWIKRITSMIVVRWPRYNLQTR